jgi:tRNA 2-thiouridine synthesizing protein C
MPNLYADTIAIVNKSAPYGSANGQESLDMALALGNFAQPVSLFFIEDGVLQLLGEQQSHKIQHKAYHKTFAALEFYDIEEIFVCRHSLTERGLSASDLAISVQLIESAALTTQLATYRHLMVF